MEDGTHWPSNLRESLHHAKYMVAVLAPPYFGSAWCLAEWETMQKRARFLDLGAGMTPGLIQPVRFIGGDSFPAEARAIQDGDSDYRPFNSLPPPSKATLRSRDYRRLELKVQSLAEKLAGRIAAAPPWRQEWPLLQVPVRPVVPPPLAFKQVGLG
jgi:hypothetical protein